MSSAEKRTFAESEISQDLRECADEICAAIAEENGVEPEYWWVGPNTFRMACGENEIEVELRSHLNS